jgi:hypothetical protein
MQVQIQLWAFVLEVVNLWNLIPSRYFVRVIADINYNKSFPFSDDTAVQKQTYQAPESKHNVIRWVVDSHFKKEQERLKIPTGVDILRGI